MSLARREWNPKNSNRYHGYCPVIPGVADYKENVEFSLDLPQDDPCVLSNVFYEPNVWLPDSVSGAADFKEFVLKYYQSMSDLLLKVAHRRRIISTSSFSTSQCPRCDSCTTLSERD